MCNNANGKGSCGYQIKVKYGSVCGSTQHNAENEWDTRYMFLNTLMVDMSYSKNSTLAI